MDKTTENIWAMAQDELEYYCREGGDAQQAAELLLALDESRKMGGVTYRLMYAHSKMLLARCQKQMERGRLILARADALADGLERDLKQEKMRLALAIESKKLLN